MEMKLKGMEGTILILETFVPLTSLLLPFNSL